MSAFGLLGLGSIVVVAVMTGLFLLGKRIANFSYVDIGWSANFTVLSLLYGVLGDGAPVHRLLLCTMYGVWGARLAWHLGRRVIGHPEEGRYVELRTRWGAAGESAFLRRMYRFYLIQAALDVVLALPLLLAATDARPELSPFEWAAAVLWVIALLGESIADATLDRFKADPNNRGRVCDVGLWRYSRHPNYFFEWLVWVAYALACFASLPWGAFGILLPALMLYFLLRVTGIPATEAQALRSRGAAYADYQARTSPFVPLPPRRSRS